MSQSLTHQYPFIVGKLFCFLFKNGHSKLTELFKTKRLVFASFLINFLMVYFNIASFKIKSICCKFGAHFDLWLRWETEKNEEKEEEEITTPITQKKSPEKNNIEMTTRRKTREFQIATTKQWRTTQN